MGLSEVLGTLPSFLTRQQQNVTITALIEVCNLKKKEAFSIQDGTTPLTDSEIQNIISEFDSYRAKGSRSND